MYRTANSVIFLALVMILLPSCKDSLKEDHSLTIKEYVKMGMPDHKKNWTNDEYINANITLGTLKINNPLAFPRKNSKRSGDLFMRLVSKENLSFTNNLELPLRSRAFLIQHYPRFQYELTQLYTDASREEQYYNEELIETYIFGLYIHGKMLDLAGIIMNSEREEEKSIHEGLGTVVFNYLKTLSNIMEEQVKTNIYKAEDLDRISMEVKNSIEHNLDWILPADKQKLSVKIQKVIDETPTPEVKVNYGKVLEMVIGN